VILTPGRAEAAYRAGLDWNNAQGIRRIIVHGGAASAQRRAQHRDSHLRPQLAAGEVVQPPT